MRFGSWDKSQMNRNLQECTSHCSQQQDLGEDKEVRAQVQDGRRVRAEALMLKI